MEIDLSAATAFMATHARVLDRRRFELREGRGDPSGVLAALHAFEAFEDVAPATAPRAAALCDWLGSVTLADGGLPMALPLSLAAGSAPWWQKADPSVSSLQITAVVAATAQRVAAHDPAVAAHPWLERATSYCLNAIADLEEEPFAYVLASSLQLLDAVHDSRPEAGELLRRLGRYVPADGQIRVTGGTEGEALRSLDVVPYPGRPARELFPPEVIAADLDRLAAGQRDDGGWTVDFTKVSPAGTLDWRGHVTLRAIDVLRRNGRV